jgi:RNA polymerase sigma-70 factor (ECF subfamily)
MDDHESHIKRSQAGDLDAFAALVRTNQGWLRGWLRSQLRDWTAADDLAQDTFVTAFGQIRNFRGDGSFESWLRGIANNHFRNYLRKKREDYIGGELELQALLTTEDEGGGVCSNVSLNALHECLSLVKGPARKLLDDRYLIGKSVREIAQESDASYSALTMKFHRLRQSLAECIETKLERSSS